MSDSVVASARELMLSESADRLQRAAAQLNSTPAAELLRVLRRNNVVFRGLSRLTAVAPPADPAFVGGALAEARRDQRMRLTVLKTLVPMFDTAGVRYVVYKTLDSWPDLGNDIDILTADADGPAHWRPGLAALFPAGCWKRPRKVCEMISAKRTFEVPSSCDLEIHAGRVGQVGEYPEYARAVIDRRVRWESDGLATWVPAAEDQLLLAVLHRVYRHFWFRVGDIVNAVDWIDRPDLDWEYVWATATALGIRLGLHRYLGDVLGVVESTEAGPRLAERLRAHRVHRRRLLVRRDFYRMPTVADPLVLYGAKLGHDLRRGRLASAARVALVFPLGLLGYLINALFGTEPVW